MKRSAMWEQRANRALARFFVTGDALFAERAALFYRLSDNWKL